MKGETKDETQGLTRDMVRQGSLHPLTQTIDCMTSIFATLGYDIVLGPEIETEENNFDALNVPKDHPARDMQDTFWLKKDNKLLRTQTSTHQVPYMRTHTPPIAMVSFGKVYRQEATDATHEAHFYQVEGLAVDKKGNVTLAHLKGVLSQFLKEMFSEEVEFRFRPGYFPFVEPGIEVDMKFDGKWMEVLGAGMIHPQVLKNGGLDPEEMAGFAFGIGVERLMMIRHGIPDVRMSYQSDLRFINQF
jgi:phenylalanyl-tRNA synthetase alpha chain